MKHDCVQQNLRTFRQEIPYVIHYFTDVSPCGIQRGCLHTKTGFFRYWANGKRELIE